VFDDFLLQHESKDNHLITDYFIRLSHCSQKSLRPKSNRPASLLNRIEHDSRKKDDEIPLGHIFQTTWGNAKHTRTLAFRQIR
jgi:hypothetical protein